MSTNYFRNSPIALFLLPLLRWNVCCTSSKYVPVSEYIWWVTEIQSLILIQKKVNIAPNTEHYILLLCFLACNIRNDIYVRICIIILLRTSKLLLCPYGWAAEKRSTPRKHVIIIELLSWTLFCLVVGFTISWLSLYFLYKRWKDQGKKLCF